METLIDTNRIRTDLGTQIRISTSDDTVREYVDCMERGNTFPPLSVVYDDEQDYFILVDGFHRLAAHQQVRPNDQILADVKPGNIETAKWESIAANQTSQLCRTNADKRNAVEQALLHPKGEGLSDREIARHVGVNKCTVNRIRDELESCGALRHIETRTAERNGTTYQQNTANIGKHRPTSIKMTGSGFVVVKNPPPPGAGCPNCLYWDKTRTTQGGYSYCEYRDEETATWDSCNDWAKLTEEITQPAEEVQTVNEDLDKAEIWPPPIPRGKKLYQYEKTRDSINVHLPCKNAELFAVELRNHFDEEYMYAVWAAYKKIAADTE